MLLSARRFASALLALALVAGCPKSDTVLFVTMEGTVTGITQLKVNVTAGGRMKAIDVPSTPALITLPTTFTIEMDAGVMGAVALAVEARDAGQNVVARGMGNIASVVAGERNDITIGLSSQPAAPAAPTGLTAAAGDRAVSLTWSTVPGAVSYNLYHSTTAPVTKSSGIKIGSATSPATHAGLVNGTRYYYVVTAVGVGGESVESMMASAVPQVTPTVPPSGISATPGDGRVTLAWAEMPAATSFNVYFGTAAGVTKAAGTKVQEAANPFAHTGRTNGTRYYYVVTAVNGAGEGAESMEVSAIPQVEPPAAPTGLSASPGDGEVTLTWGVVSGATNYNLYFSTTTGVTKTTGTKIANATLPYTHAGRSNGTTYHYIVTAENAGGEGPASTAASATPQVLAPAAPTGIGAAAGDGQATVTWNAVTGASSYNIYFATSPGVTTAGGTKITGVASPYVHTGRQNGTTYYYKVTAQNTGGESPLSVEASVTPQVSVPGAPTNVTAVAGDAQVTVSWTGVAGAVSYNLYYSNISPVTTSGSTKLTGVATPHPIAGLANGATYYFRVAAVNPGGEGPLSSEVSARPQVPAPATPTGLSAAGGDGQVTVSWSGVSGASTYNLYFADSPGVTTASMKLAGVNSPYVHAGRLNGITYYYRVTAQNAGGESAPSAEASATPQVPAPVAPTGVVAVADDMRATVTWAAVAGATSYNIYWQTTSPVTLAGSTKITGVASGYVHMPLVNGTTYYYRVTAQNAGGESALSASEGAATPQVPAPGPPTSLMAAVNGANIDLTWTAPATGSAVVTYKIYRGPAAMVSTTGSPYATVMAQQTTYSDTAAAATVPYYYVVTASNAGGDSTASNEVSATVP